MGEQNICVIQICAQRTERRSHRSLAVRVIEAGVNQEIALGTTDEIAVDRLERAARQGNGDTIDISKKLIWHFMLSPGIIF